MSEGTKQSKDSYTTMVKRSILGAKVVNREREDLGTIEDLVIDTRDSRIAYAILSFGGIFRVVDKHFAIPWAALAFNVAEKVAVLNVDKDRLNNAPGFDKDNWPDMADTAWGSQIHGHYGYRPYWENEAGGGRVEPR
jgi:sporulation protein YlmC with PRC-barrel domain